MTCNDDYARAIHWNDGSGVALHRITGKRVLAEKGHYALGPCYSKPLRIVQTRLYSAPLN